MKMLMFILVAVLLGGLCFGVTYIMFKPDPAKQVATTQPASAPANTLGALPQDRSAYQENVAAAEADFDDLARQLRTKQAQLEQKETQLRLQEVRLAEEAGKLKQEVAKLESVQMQTLEALRQVSEAKDNLDKSRVIIAREEKTNLKLLVAKYNAMSSAQAGEIFQSMCKSGKEEVVVRILYTMNERTAAKILADMPDKSVSARLTEMLLRVRDDSQPTT